MGDNNHLKINNYYEEQGAGYRKWEGSNNYIYIIQDK